MTNKRDISTPTIISICVTGDYILMKDLNGKPHIFPKTELAAIGNKLVVLACDEDLPFTDVGKANLSDDKSEVEGEGFIDLTDLSPEGIKNMILKGVLGQVKQYTSYPRGKPKSSNK